MTLASFLLILLVQLPLTIKYYKLSKLDPSKYAHMRGPMFLAPFVTFPAYYYASQQVNNLTMEYGNKYLRQLTNDEIKNFEQEYAARKASYQR